MGYVFESTPSLTPAQLQRASTPEVRHVRSEMFLDASELVHENVRRLLASAPVLTAVCAFREYPDLRYCVCRCESNGSGFSVLSRAQLEAALSTGCYAAAFHRDNGRPLRHPSGTSPFST